LHAVKFIHTGDLSVPAVEIADDVAQVFLRRHDPHLHHRLEQAWPGFRQCFTEAGAGRDLER
jgi:hypothetical protein